METKRPVRNANKSSKGEVFELKNIAEGPEIVEGLPTEEAVQVLESFYEEDEAEQVESFEYLKTALNASHSSGRKIY